MADEQALEALLVGGRTWSEFRSERALRPAGQIIDLTNSDLGGADLSDADLVGVYLTGSDLAGAALGGANLTHAFLDNVNLTHAFLEDANLTDADLLSADLDRAHLVGADLTYANLAGADLTNANLTNANLTNANLIGADLINANLTRANLTRANLTRANVAGANLTGAKLNGTRLGDLSVSGSTRNTQGLHVGDFLIGRHPSKVGGSDVPDPGTVRIAIPDLPGGMDAGELARLSDAIAVVAEMSQRVGAELGRRLLRDDDRGRGTSVLTATAGDDFGPIVLQRIQYGSLWFHQLWDAAPAFAAGAAAVAGPAAIVVKRARESAEDGVRVFSLMLTLARRSERDAYFAMRDARAEANTAEEVLRKTRADADTAEEVSRKTRADADTTEHESRRDKSTSASNSATEAIGPEVDTLRLGATPTTTELTQRLQHSELSALVSEAELNRIASILAPLLVYPVEVSRQRELLPGNRSDTRESH
ncbi:pentapeptide repeat-containing protein [Rhodococcus sp. IEGM 1381]|uniref:pentapeptide repeat-containing protein n=1 Tax=Rhodococcus sp. IEGM 1381 TaxID=3047085 RepID=UPI0024B6BE84|nr:pentapeptide repeat-containing protein [Rhodococcus sp. IEGM 1381]MDI9894725.1 pentapeptide repeat-containing protein [Rhodococcus sp. IEGM 1381]